MRVAYLRVIVALFGDHLQLHCVAHSVVMVRDCCACYDVNASLPLFSQCVFCLCLQYPLYCHLMRPQLVHRCRVVRKPQADVLEYATALGI